jgi:hypothetical protein
MPTRLPALLVCLPPITVTLAQDNPLSEFNVDSYGEVKSIPLRSAEKNASLLHDRLSGFAAHAFSLKGQDGVLVDPHFIPLTQLTPAKFLATPGLWIGLGVAAIFLAAAVRLRRYREPI